MQHSKFFLSQRWNFSFSTMSRICGPPASGGVSVRVHALGRWSALSTQGGVDHRTMYATRSNKGTRRMKEAVWKRRAGL